MPIEITTPVGRLVAGHPMIGHPQKDDKTGLPKTQTDGVTPVVQYYCGLAIPKGTETHWNQTPWGQKIQAEGVASWPGGEHLAPDFAWKITDGDSQIPNKKQKRPCDKEGYPGHWVINASNGFLIKAYHRGMFNPSQVIQQKEAIKTGDYGRLALTIKGNNPSQSPGVYVNPSMFELYQAGIEIVTESTVDPSAAFADAGSLPANALIDPNIPAQGTQAAAPAQPGQPAVVPANDFAAGPGGGPASPGGPAIVAEVKYVTSDGSWTEAQLLTAGYSAAQIASFPLQVN